MTLEIYYEYRYWWRQLVAGMLMLLIAGDGNDEGGINGGGSLLKINLKNIFLLAIYEILTTIFFLSNDSTNFADVWFLKNYYLSRKRSKKSWRERENKVNQGWRGGGES